MTKAPVLKRKIQGTTRYNWKVCPFSTVDQSGRIPSNQKSIHTTTSGRMRLSIRDGYDGVGWVCDDPKCSYYLGTAHTPATMVVKNVSVNITTGEYTITPETVTIPMCSGTWFWEK
jgi:hypothetical protein